MTSIWSRPREWFENEDGTGNLASRGGLLEGSILELGDYNDDGWIDALVLSDRDEFGFRFGSASWSQFERGPTVPKAPFYRPIRAVVDDFDLDGLFDVVVVLRTDSASFIVGVTWFRQSSEGFLAGNPLLPAALDDPGLLATDVNGDGHNDLIYNDAVQLFDPAANQFAPSRPLDPVSHDVPLKVIDIDGDGDLDLVTVVQRTDCLYDPIQGCELSVYWRENLDGQGKFAPEPKRIVSPEVRGRFGSVIVADIDGDGDTDVLYESLVRGRYETRWVENLDGRGNFGDEIGRGSFDAPLLTTADLDGDGRLDLIRRSPSELQLQRGSHGFREPVTILAVGRDISDIEPIDWDGDGDLDLVARRRTNDRGLQLVWYENRDGLGDLGTEQLILDSNARNFDQYYVANINDRQGFEIILQRRRGNVVLYALEDNGEWQASVIVPSPVAALEFADIDSDGSLDFLLRSADGRSSVNFNDGQGSFSSQPVGRQFTIFRSIADLDGDQDLDLIESGTTWWESRPVGDANGDDLFNSADLVAIMAAGLYEDDIPQNATFQDGDWNGDGDVDSSDLVFAFQTGSYTAAAESRLPAADDTLRAAVDDANRTSSSES